MPTTAVALPSQASIIEVIKTELVRAIGEADSALDFRNLCFLLLAQVLPFIDPSLFSLMTGMALRAFLICSGDKSFLKQR